jgi:hypothetical protein
MMTKGIIIAATAFMFALTVGILTAQSGNDASNPTIRTLALQYWNKNAVGSAAHDTRQGADRVSARPPRARAGSLATTHQQAARHGELTNAALVHKEYKESPGRAGASGSPNKGETLERPEPL